MSDFETKARDERIAELKAEIANLRSDLHKVSVLYRRECELSDALMARMNALGEQILITVSSIKRQPRHPWLGLLQ